MRSTYLIAMVMTALFAMPAREGAGSGGGAARHSTSEQTAEQRAVQVEMRNILYHYSDNVAIHIRRLQGEIVPTAGNEVPVFDDKHSFVLHIESAEIAISASSLANALNNHVLAGHDAPMKDLRITTDGNHLRVKGKLNKQGDIPFETKGSLSVTPDGKIRMHADKIKALHLPVKGLLDLFGVEIADLIKTNKVRGIRAEKDDLIMDPMETLPPPQTVGKLTAVRVEPNNIVEAFGDGHPALTAYHGNYMAYKNNHLRFGKLTMEKTDMILIDMDPHDPFDFSLDHYREQLSAGYTKITKEFGLRVFMRDYDKVRKGRGGK